METTEALGRLEHGEKEMEVKDQSAQTREGRTHRRALGCEQMRWPRGDGEGRYRGESFEL